MNGKWTMGKGVSATSFDRHKLHRGDNDDLCSINAVYLNSLTTFYSFSLSHKISKIMVVLKQHLRKVHKGIIRTFENGLGHKIGHFAIFRSNL